MVRALHAYQHIYANVEPEQSPRGQGGFQTLFYTHAGLSEAEVAEMEARLLYFPGAGDPAKRLFFNTSTGKRVLAQVVPLPEPDRFGRGGRYLAHSLVLDPEQFAALGANPFHVWRHAIYVTTVEEALERGDFHTGDVPPLSFDLPEEGENAQELARGWPGEALRKLTLLALRAERLAGKRSAVAFLGGPRQVEEALEVGFLAVPTACRPRCTFDTYFHRGNLVATYFWAIGLPESPRRPNLVEVDARIRQAPAFVPDQPETAYERWVLEALDAGDLDAAARYRDVAYALCEWLDDHPADEALLDSAPPQVIGTVLRLSPEQVRARLRRMLQDRLPPLLAERVFAPLSQAEAPQLLQWLREGVDASDLLDALFNTYAADRFRAPPRRERGALRGILERTAHQDLRLLQACWDGRREPLRRELGQAGKEAYRWFVQAVLPAGLVDPLDLLVPVQVDAFLDLYLASAALEEHGLAPLAEELLELGLASSLVRLVPHLQDRPAREIKALRKVAGRQTGLPEAFRRALEM